MLGSVREGVNQAMAELRSGNGPQPAYQTDILTMGERPNAAFRQPANRFSNRPANRSTTEVRTHIVRKGETLWAIAEQYYGTGFVHEDLLKYNASRIRTAKGISPGLVLLVPDRSDLGRTPRKTSRSTPTYSQPKTARKTATVAMRTYTVKKGDTLSEISQAELGTSKRWEEILGLNRSKLDEATDIRIGMKIKLPTR